MALDITAYSRLKHIGHHPIDPELNEGDPGPYCYYTGHVPAYAHEEFRQSFRGIPVLNVRPVQGGRFLEGGCAEVTDETQTHDFHAGPYGAYGRWREDLQAQFNPDRDPAEPFYELIWFADNEGAIGPRGRRRSSRRLPWPCGPVCAARVVSGLPGDLRELDPRVRTCRRRRLVRFH